MGRQSTGMEGVGLGYHPLLHETMVSGRFEFDFIEIPIDLYVGSARSPLLDPEGSRLGGLAAAKPCVWRGSALSLGSVETPDDPSPDARIIEQIRELLDKTGVKGTCEAIGFRRLADRDMGLGQALPYTQAAAQWTALRHAAAAKALGCPLLLEPSVSSVGAPRAEWDAAAFLQNIADHADCRFLLDVADLRRFAGEASIEAAEMVRRVPGERIAAWVISSDGEEDWQLLSQLSQGFGARAIIVRRSTNLFPLDAVGSAARRAKDLLARSGAPAPVPLGKAVAPAPIDPKELAALRAFQLDFINRCLDPEAEPPGFVGARKSEWATLATRARSWQSWQARLEDTYKARQMRQFLARE